jgi:hypothetical protein
MGSIRALVQHGSALISAKLGRCPKCMGLSLSGAVIGWAVLAGVVQFWPQFPYTALLALWPASFTALWVLHITTFGGRAVACVRRETLSVERTEPAALSLISRRGMVGLFARSVGLAALASAAVSVNAFAANSIPLCTCSAGTAFCGGCHPCPGSVCLPKKCTPVSGLTGVCA